jgi:hypothetical protein
MLSHQEAVATAEREIANLEPLPSSDSWVIYDQRTIERPFGWVFFYGSRLYAETGDITYAVAGNAPLIVNRHTGEVITTGAAQPVEHYIAEYESLLLHRSA